MSHSLDDFCNSNLFVDSHPVISRVSRMYKSYLRSIKGYDMPHISLSTYARALSGNTLPHIAAGNYENKLSTKIMKGIAWVLTAGIAYGFTRLIEHYCNVTPKIAEFCANAGTLHDHLADAVRDGLYTIDIELTDGKILIFEQVSLTAGRKAVVRITEGEDTAEVEGNFEDICMRLEEGFFEAPAYYDYDIDEEHKTVRERIAEYNSLPQALGTIPGLDKYIIQATSMEDAKGRRAADTKARYHRYWGDSLSNVSSSTRIKWAGEPSEQPTERQ
ncbi:effector protein steA [Salmonella enterica subsp. houtenae]|nr:effector protein steA [Salmonella enterica subsp. houtenae]EAW2133294.1 effector protein steA [Salmonella enterica subsp. enterica]EAX9868983.1 effector protein steA [Salmonella enterica]EHB8800535.1 effector protein steA [Salmonella enterica subsp. enterica serovar Rough O:z4,z23:-]EBO4454794.1 effector protein steA [Salmonella enterica]